MKKSDKIYIQEGAVLRTEKTYDNDVCYIRLDSLPEQPVTDCHDFEQGLQEEIENYFDGWCNDDEYGDALMSDYTGVNVDNCKDIARFFAEWGAEHAKK